MLKILSISFRVGLKYRVQDVGKESVLGVRLRAINNYVINTIYLFQG